jgi:AcrR family transcriptional regulator
MPAHPSARRPGRPRVSEKTTPGSRARLLEVAAAVFAERGYRTATVDEIVARAGLSKGTFYWHFDSKDQLFQELLDERIDRPARALMEVTRSAPAEEATAPVVSRGVAAMLEQEREVVLLLHEYWSAAVRDERLRARYIERQKALRETLAEALAARHARTGVPLGIPAEALATAFIALAEGLSLEALIDPDSVSAELYGEILALVYDGLVLRSQPPR